MDLSALVAGAVAGDGAAFAELVRRHQAMAFGYARAILRDAHLAEDAVQEAFLAAYRDLAKLEDASSFPAWLRGIVRHQCGRCRRRRRVPTAPLAAALAVAAEAPGPDRQVEEREGLARLRAAIAALPQPQREVATLCYLGDYSQGEIAAFLGLPVTTVNNQLHTARQRLREGLPSATGGIPTNGGLPAALAARVGWVIRARGPVVEVRFAPDALPPVLTTLAVAEGPRRPARALGVAQHLGGGVTRCLAVAPDAGDGPVAGLEVINTERPVGVATGDEGVRRAITILRRAAESAALVETGIKAIDLLCPYAEGGAVGFIGDMGAGKMTLVAEVMQALARAGADLTLFTFVQPGAEVDLLRGAAPTLPATSAGAICLPVEDAAGAPAAAALDAVTYVSRGIAATGRYPAVDPLRSRSRSLRGEIVGREHIAVAAGVRRLLRRARILALRTGGREGFGAQERALAARAAKVRNFLTQPLFVAESFTHLPGRVVARAATVAAFAALLRGDCDALPEEAFLMCGALDEAIAKAGAAVVATPSATGPARC